MFSHFSGRRWHPFSGSSGPASIHDQIEKLGLQALRDLREFVAIDSQSLEDCSDKPSSAGQVLMADCISAKLLSSNTEHLRDEFSNLIAFIPASSDEFAELAPIAFIAHMDTSEGTLAESNLRIVHNWPGNRIPYASLVSVNTHPSTAKFLGDDLIVGSGRAPFGLDCKNGCALQLALVSYFNEHPEIRHGPIVLVFRTDEEIGREESLAPVVEVLKARGVTHAYTVDGVNPFEINIDNFRASKIPLEAACDGSIVLPTLFRQKVELDIRGVTAHTITGQEEGILNAITIFSRVIDRLKKEFGIVPESFVSDAKVESNGAATFYLAGETPDQMAALLQQLSDAFREELAPHTWRGAGCTINAQTCELNSPQQEISLAALNLANYLIAFEGSNPGFALLPQDSKSWDGISYPVYAQAQDGKLHLDLRLRDFSPELLERREKHAKSLAQELFGEALLNSEPIFQYDNSGPTLAKHPELIFWARSASIWLGVQAELAPMRGGLGVDPFLREGINAANLAAGYYGAEGPREFTSVQMLGRHAIWLAEIARVYSQLRPEDILAEPAS